MTECSLNARPMSYGLPGEAEYPLESQPYIDSQLGFESQHAVQPRNIIARLYAAPGETSARTLKAMRGSANRRFLVEPPDSDAEPSSDDDSETSSESGSGSSASTDSYSIRETCLEFRFDDVKWSSGAGIVIGLVWFGNI